MAQMITSTMVGLHGYSQKEKGNVCCTEDSEFCQD